MKNEKKTSESEKIAAKFSILSHDLLLFSTTTATDPLIYPFQKSL